MKKFLILMMSLVAAMTLSACSDDNNNDKNKAGKGGGGAPINKAAYPNEAGTIYGQWTAPGANSVISLYINRKNQMALGADCNLNNKKASITTIVPITVNEGQNSIQMNQPAKVKQDMGGGALCEIDVPAGQLLYQLAGNQLTLQAVAMNNQQFVFQRIDGAVAPAGPGMPEGQQPEGEMPEAFPQAEQP